MAPTNEELIAMAQKMLAKRAADAAKGKKYNAAVKKLIAAHQAEFATYLK